MATGYEDIDRLTEQQGTMLDESLKQQQDIVNKQTQMNVDALERNKQEIDQQTKKTNQGLYTEYKKASNPYGVNAEATYARGLGNSGYAETTQTNLYNTYQKNVTDTINNAQKLKADFDFKINQAMQNGNLTIAQNALEIYKQKMQLLTQEYELRNNREQYLYSKEQDALKQSNWEKEYAYQQERDRVSDNQWQQSFDYQKQRDAVADSQWAKEYALSSRKASGGNSLYVGDEPVEGNEASAPISQNVQKLFDGLTSYGVTNTTDNALKEKARQLIYADYKWGRITNSEAKYLMEQLNLEED
jgi:hypothetical protein